MLSAASETRVAAVFEFLERRGLDADSIDAACCQELKRVLTYRYESQFSKSTRLGGRGWGQGHITAHMDRFLKNKLRNSSLAMRAAVCGQDDLTDDYLDALLMTEAGGEAAGPDAGDAGDAAVAGNAGDALVAKPARLASSLDDLDFG